jgi:hypothetical protein
LTAKLLKTTIERQGGREKEQSKLGPEGEGVGMTESNDRDIHGWGRRRAALGQAKLALRFQIPLQASLHGIVKTHHPLAARMALLRSYSGE